MLLSLWDKPGALPCIARGLFLDPPERMCGKKAKPKQNQNRRVKDRERKNTLNHHNFINLIFFFLRLFDKNNLKIYLQSKWIYCDLKAFALKKKKKSVCFALAPPRGQKC